MSAAPIDCASFAFGLGTNASICDRALIATAGATDIAVPTIGEVVVVAVETTFNASTLVIEVAHCGSANDATTFLESFSGCDILFAAPDAATCLDAADVLAPLTGIGRDQISVTEVGFSFDLGLSAVRLSPLPPFAALARRQIGCMSIGAQPSAEMPG